MVEGTLRRSLAGKVDSIVAYRQLDHELAASVEMPSTSLTFIVGYGSQIDVEAPGATGAEDVSSFASGLHEGHVVVRSAGQQRGVQLGINPLYSRALLGVPAGEISGLTVPLDRLFGAEAALLEERLAGIDGFGCAIEVVEEALSRRLSDVAPPPHLEWAWSRIAESGGTVEVSALASEIGCSRRHLSEGFREHVGLPPKTVARLARFRRALERLEPGGVDTARVAIDAGYYDQAHFNRDFKQFTGMSPREYERRRLVGSSSASHSS